MAALPTAATFDGPKELAIDRAGNLLIVDTENHAIRRIDAEPADESDVGRHRSGVAVRGTAAPTTSALLDREALTVSPARPDGRRLHRRYR